MPQNISKWSDPKINSVGFLQRNIKWWPAGKCLSLTFWNIWDISILLTKKWTAKLPRFREFTFDARPALNLLRDPVLPSRRTPRRSCIHVWYKSAILEMGFVRTRRLKCAANILSIWFDRIIFSNWLFLYLVIWGCKNKTAPPKKTSHPNPNKVTFTLLSLSHFPTKILGFIQRWQCCIAFLRSYGSQGSIGSG